MTTVAIPVNLLCATDRMTTDASPEHAPMTVALVNALVAQLSAFGRAVSRAELRRATVAELHQLIAALDAVEAALDPLVATADAANAAS